MPQISRSKPRKCKPTRSPIKKTARRELRPEEKAFIAGAVFGGNASHNAMANMLDRDQSGVSKMINKVKRKAEEGQFELWDPILYEQEPGRQRPEILTPAQKEEIVRIVTQDREHREKESWQAIADGDFKDLPPMSISTFENAMYEAGYRGAKPGWKPPLTEKEMAQRRVWAEAHNPDKHEKYDNLGFNFQKVVYTDETAARVGEQRGMQRAWMRPEERYDEDIKKDRVKRYCQLQFYGAFTYDSKGPCHIYETETKEEKKQAQEVINKENKDRREKAETLHRTTRSALKAIGEPVINSRKKPYKKIDDYKRGQRSRGGIDG